MRRINLALQGGGAHGAFTWGVLDRLLREDGIEIAGISGTSAGALNGAAVKSGLARGGRQAARENLDWLWEQVGAVGDVRLGDWFRAFLPIAGIWSGVTERLAPFSPVDVASVDKWDAYTKAKLAMFRATDTNDAPWTIVSSDCKKRARLAVMRCLLGQLDYDHKDAEAVGIPDPLIVSGVRDAYRLPGTGMPPPKSRRRRPALRRLLLTLRVPSARGASSARRAPCAGRRRCGSRSDPTRA